MRARRAGEERRPEQASRTAAIFAVLSGTALIAVLMFVFLNRPRIPAPGSPPGAVTVGTGVGERLPDFRLVDVAGRKVSRASLVASTPGLIFFTATWCLPCIEGLRQLMVFQRDVGGNPFSVLVVFIDPRETNDDLLAYRDRFGFPPGWYYALDTDDMVVRYGIRYLDTKFVVDQQGIIRYTDVRPADYNTWRRALATVGISP